MSELIEITTTEIIEVAGDAPEQLVVTEQLASLEVVDVGSQGPQGVQGIQGLPGPFGSVITGYVSGAGTVAATDTIVEAIGKLDGNTAGKSPAAGSASIVTVGTVTAGTWNGSVVAGQYGGTGIDNTGKTITLGGNLETSGAYASTFTMTGVTTVTFPTTGTLATRDGTETLTNKTFTGYTETVYSVTGTTPALSPSNGTIQTWTLSGNSTPTAGTWGAGQSLTLMIDDGTAYTIAWTSLAVTWKTGGGVAPTLNTTGYTAITLVKVGSTIYGWRSGDA